MRDLTAVTEPLLKPTATIHVGNKLSFIERKMFNAIIWHSQQKIRLAKNADTLSIGLLLSLIGLERSKNMDVIRDAIKTLTTTPIIWNTLKKDRSTDWGICTFLAGAEISGGRLRYVLNPLLVEKVDSPTIFAKIQLLVQTQFSSQYSLALYEFMIDERCRSGNPKTHEVRASLDTLRHVLHFDGPYKHLNNDVLKPCVREINEHSDLFLTYQPEKNGRSVVAILFSIERAAVQIPLPLVDMDIVTSDEGDVLLEKDILILSLVNKGLSRIAAIKLVETYDGDRIRGNIAYVEKECGAGKVKNPPAFLLRAIEEDYRPKKTPEELHKEDVAATDSALHEERRKYEALEREWNKYREKRVRERFAALFPVEQDAKRQAFVATLPATNSIVFMQYKKEGFGSRLVETEFFASLRDELLTDQDETSFDAYRKRYDVTTGT